VFGDEESDAATSTGSVRRRRDVYIQDESWAMPWSNTAPRFMHSAKVHGVRWNLADYMQTNDAWLST
jgi:hypothetical protein